MNVLERFTRFFRNLTSDGIGQEGIGHSDESAIVIFMFPVILGNRLNFHLNKKKTK